mmetsp:Transcript_120231/g.224755  ORF Transcript_120231/g.224755 Transcript_120231/m.224755 type:complete len:295 (+) Transcript_120231:2269-3153(+)
MIILRWTCVRRAERQGRTADVLVRLGALKARAVQVPSISSMDEATRACQAQALGLLDAAVRPVRVVAAHVQADQLVCVVLVQPAGRALIRSARTLGRAARGIVGLFCANLSFTQQSIDSIEFWRCPVLADVLRAGRPLNAASLFIVLVALPLLACNSTGIGPKHVPAWTRVGAAYSIHHATLVHALVFAIRSCAHQLVCFSLVLEVFGTLHGMARAFSCATLGHVNLCAGPVLASQLPSLKNVCETIWALVRIAKCHLITAEQVVVLNAFEAWTVKLMNARLVHVARWTLEGLT